MNIGIVLRLGFWKLAVITPVLAFLLAGSASAGERGVVYQVSTISALLEGVYDGDVTIADLRRHGDFGIGTVNGLDGEMVGVDGKFYQIKSDGRAYPVKDDMRTPFAVVSFFEKDLVLVPERPMDCDELERYIDLNLPTRNIFYSVRIDGIFSHVKTRSVPRQKRPYPRLIEVTKKQSVFDLNDTGGIIAGVKFPAYMAGINVPGYHFHFITDDRSAGGHVLGCEARNVKISISYGREFDMTLPAGGDFDRTDLTQKKDKELESAEKLKEN